MWDRLLVDCNIATFEERPGNALGLVENAAIGIADGKIVRVGKRTELAGRLQERYSYAKDEAEKNIDTWLNSIH